jgi:hypothetical protein
MEAGAPTACPRCGSTDTKRFEDGSGLCTACGRAFRGTAAGTRLVGEEVETVRRGPPPREKVKVGLLGLFGGIVGFVSIPTVFLLGAALSRMGVTEYVSATFNRPEGALACGGLSLLVIGAWYATWAGLLVWRGYPERRVHLIVSGALLAGAAALAGLGVPGAVGIAGGTLTLVAGLLVWRMVREREKAETPPPPAPESS